MHALRQRRAMKRLLCQVCGGVTEGRLPGGRRLFLVRAVEGHPVGEGERTASPPLCPPCALDSLRHCPHLRRGHTAALVEEVRPWGVAGLVHHPRTLRRIPTPEPLTLVPYGSPLLDWTLAARIMTTLHGCTPVDVRELTARHAWPRSGEGEGAGRPLPAASKHGTRRHQS
ncbi:hypothetical protein [Streptomyces physcomitrii]|uniref:Uncharacterized protein n=1 Tax=Streptomyces physcomitrii TaxID=2724184 RepID=A0ABX1H2H3_9ACTN|nr:hypothetical protein [Streptomyces physcomitrii]NKI42564.1 hypothetical protein [Streptomyces physcomitrii]